MDDSSTYLALLLVLISLGSVISTAYIALSNVRPAQLSERAEDGDLRSAQILSLIGGRSRLQMSYLISMTLIHFSISALTLLLLVEPLILRGQAGIALLVVGLVALATVVLAWSVPEGIGTANAEWVARLMVVPMTLLCRFLSSLTWLLLAISRTLAGVFGGEKLVDTVTEEEIMTLVNAGHTGGAIEEEEKTMIYSVLQLDQSSARQLMVPRMDVVALDVESSIETACGRFVASGFSRIPVYEESIDNILGLLYAKDLLTLRSNSQESIRQHLRPAYFVPETLPADELLKSLKKQKIHMAIVVDEYGGTAGLVTIEDLIEEIIGDIVDEYDQNEQSDVTRLSDDSYLIDGTTNLADINEQFDLDLDDEETDTLGGFIYAELGRVPQEGEQISGEGYRLTVRRIEGRRIRHVLLELVRPDASPKTDTDPTPEVSDT